MSDVNYADMLPSAPSQKLWDMAERYWADTNAIIMNVVYVKDPLTDTSKKLTQCHCTACDTTFHRDYVPSGYCTWSRTKYGFFNERTSEEVTSGSDTICPECGAPVRVKSISDIYGDTYTLGIKRFVEVIKIHNKVCVVSWELYKKSDKKGEVFFSYTRDEAYVADGKKMFRCSGQRRYFNSYQIYNQWIQTKRFDDCLGSVKEELLLPFDADVLIGTSCENSKLDIFANGDSRMIVSYLRLWQKHPNVENLVMQGHSSLVEEALEKAAKQASGYYSTWRGSSNVTDFDFKRARPHEMLELSKEDYIGAIKNKLSLSLINCFKFYKEYDRRVTPDNVEFIKKTLMHHYDKVKESGASLVTVCKYIAKQKKKYPVLLPNISVQTLLDYWNLANKRNIDLSDPKNRYPQNLVAKHDQLVELAEFERQQELMEAFNQRAEKLASFDFADEETGLEIFACPNESQLIREGKMLNHCVATYAKRHALGETAIFFIRQIGKRDEPFFTLELDEKTYKVRQNRGLRNCARTPEVEAFEKKWVEHLKSNNIGKDVKSNGKRNSKPNSAAAVA